MIARCSACHQPIAADQSCACDCGPAIGPRPEPRAGPWSRPERDGGAARDRGMKAALDAPAAGQDVSVILHAIVTAAASGEVFSVNPIKDLFPPWSPRWSASHSA